MKRHYTFLDKFFMNIDQALRAVTDTAKTTGRQNPATKTEESEMTLAQRKHSAGLMRVNHAGEVCAQALYHGQALSSRSSHIKNAMETAAIEEGDHLAWCKERLFELGSHTSYLNPLWYASSFAIGFSAGLVGDRWSLGFLAETEQQVVQHLEKHIEEFSSHDKKSYVILKQMQHDEKEHRDAAYEAGAHRLPKWIKKSMQVLSKMMVRIAYRV